MMLTPRELEVVRLLALGRKWDAICRELRVSKHTVHKHRNNAMAKYGATCTVELLHDLGWLRVP